MRKFLKWVKDHIRPDFKYKRPKDETSRHDKFEDIKENSQIGIKIKFKF